MDHDQRKQPKISLAEKQLFMGADLRSPDRDKIEIIKASLLLFCNVSV